MQMRSFYIKYVFIAVSLVAACGSQAKTILWDLGGVLFKPDRLSMSYYELGWLDMGSYMITDQKSPLHVKDLLFDDLLYRLPAESDSQNLVAYLPDGTPMAPIMMDWLKGIISGDKIIKMLFELIEDLDTRHYFSSPREKMLLQKMVKAVFDPQVLARYTKPIAAGIKLLNECAAHGCMNIIVSNWDPYSFQFLTRSSQGRKALKVISPHHFFISGTHGLMKPDIQVFKKVLNIYQLNPGDCFFIDDQIENIKAAEGCGIKGHWLEKGDYHNLRRALIQAGYLPA
jgi:FMN phosphatase YigB (HAD superfamily)